MTMGYLIMIIIIAHVTTTRNLHLPPWLLKRKKEAPLNNNYDKTF